MTVSDSTQDPGIPARPIRLAYVVSHPIQYQAELLRRIAADPAIDLTVFFCSDFSLRSYQDTGFGVAVEWDVPLTEGYRYLVLPRWRDTTDPGPLAPISRGFFRGLYRGVDGQSFDALWIHGYSTVNALHAILAARALGIPVLLRAEPWLSDRRRSPIKLFLKRAFFRLLKPMIAAVLPIGTRNAQYWAHYFGAGFPSFLMPYAVDNDFFLNVSKQSGAFQNSLRAELDIHPGAQVILFASKLQQRKHCDHLLDAYLLLLERRRSERPPPPHLLIVGEGEQLALLEERARAIPTITFAGFRNQRELPRFLDLANVFVLPSQHEAWGLIVNEAMAVGTPVIVSTDVGCATDLVGEGDNGFVVPVGDIPALATAISSALDPERAGKMGQRSSERIAHWSYQEDIDGLKRALAFTTRLPLFHPSQHNQEPHANAAL